MDENNDINNMVESEPTIQQNTVAECDREKLNTGYNYFNACEYEKAITIFEELYNKLCDTDSDLITRNLMLMLAFCYGSTGKVEDEIRCYTRFTKINTPNSELEDEHNYQPDRVNKVIDFINKFDNNFIECYNKAIDAFQNKDFLGAVSYIEVCCKLNPIISIRNFRDIYKSIYQNALTAKEYSENKVAVYAICKDERAFVERWVESMSEADYICVLDTGSTDGTYETFVELSKTNPKIIVKQQIFTTWRFDLARNIAMSIVPDDANILVSTDLNEVFDCGWADEIKTNWDIKTHEIASYRYAWSHTASGISGKEFLENKIHTKNWIWTFPVRESLYNINTDSGAVPAEKILSLQNTVLHRYPDATKLYKDYAELFKQRYVENPNDVECLAYLAQNYALTGKYQQSIDLFNEILPGIDSNNTLLIANIYLFMGDDYRALGNNESAEKYYLDSIEVDPTYRESYLNLAQLYLDEKRYEESLNYVQLAFKNSFRHYSWFERDFSWTYQPFDILASVFYYLGEKTKAYACAIQATQIEPSDTRLQNNALAIKSSIAENDWAK